MRTVARFQFYCGDDGAGAYASAVEVVQGWANKKFESDGSSGFQIRKGSRKASFKQVVEGLSERNRTTFLSTEVVGEGLIELRTLVMEFDGQAFFQSNLRAGAADASFIEPSISVRSPRFVQDLLKSGVAWHSGRGADRVFARVFNVGAKEYKQFEELLTSPHRHLPLVLVSESQDGLEIEDIDKKILWSCCGLAHVCRIDPDASWLLTEALGKEWSCYNGAIRSYWPDIKKRNSPWLHRLWTLTSLRKLVEVTQRPSNIIIAKVCEPIFEASCYLRVPDEFETFDKMIIDEKFEALRRQAQSIGDDRALAQLYSEENDELRRSRDELTKENRTLKDNIAALLQYKTDEPSESRDASAARQAPPQTAREAVESARDRFAGQLIFSDDLEDQIESMRNDAGPPESILQHLEALSNLTSELKRRNGHIGDTQVSWLKARGLNCSGESETRKGTGLYKFRVCGVYEEYELHLKVNDAVAPDRCVRIYFKISPDISSMKVGYVGSKKLLF